MPEGRAFAQIVSLACHDLRTPLATAHGFARTLVEQGRLGEPEARYIAMIEAASLQLGDLLDRLSLLARIEAGRYEPDLAPANLTDVARAAAEGVRDGDVEVSGTDGSVRVDAVALERALHDFARCALRHGGLDRVSFEVQDSTIELAPVAREVAPIILGKELRDLGAAVAVRTIEALGGSVSVESERLVVRLDEPI